MLLLATGSKSHIFPLNIIFQKLKYCAYIDIGEIIKLSNSKEAVVKWVLNRPYQCKYVETLKDITNTSNVMYTLSKCGRPKDITKLNENILQIKNIIVSYFISPFGTDLRYATNLFNIVSGTPGPYFVQDCLLSVKDAGKKLKELFEKRITEYSNAEFFSSVKEYPLKNFEYCSQK